MFRKAGVNRLAEYRDYLGRKHGVKSQRRRYEDADTRLIGGPTTYPTARASCWSSTSSRSSSSRTTGSPRSCPAARPARAAGPGVRPARPARLADARRGLLAGPQHHRPDGGPHRPAVQRGGRPADPQQGQHGGPTALAGPARRSTTTRTGSSRATTCSRSSGSTTPSGRRYLAHPRAGRRQRAGRSRRRSSSRATSRRTSTKTLTLKRMLEAPPGRNVRARHAWLGDAVAIKDPTAATFRPAAGTTC